MPRPAGALQARDRVGAALWPEHRGMPGTEMYACDRSRRRYGRDRRIAGSTMIRSLVRKLRGDELDRILEGAARGGARRFLVFWNRGLGDIALGLYALFARIRQAVPTAEIAVLTRQDLAEAFTLLDVQRVIV